MSVEPEIPPTELDVIMDTVEAIPETPPETMTPDQALAHLDTLVEAARVLGNAQNVEKQIRQHQRHQSRITQQVLRYLRQKHNLRKIFPIGAKSAEAFTQLQLAAKIGVTMCLARDLDPVVASIDGAPTPILEGDGLSGSGVGFCVRVVARTPTGVDPCFGFDDATKCYSDPALPECLLYRTWVLDPGVGETWEGAVYYVDAEVFVPGAADEYLATLVAQFEKTDYLRRR